MKKLRIATLGILALLLILPASLKAELLYSNSGNTITITGSNPKASGNLVIPSTINNLPVTSIGGNAFNGCSGLTSVTLPSSITSIGVYAFQYCSGLTSVTLPSSLTSIGERAFWGCTGLTSVTLPSSLTSIGERAFWGCSGLKGITVDIANSTYSSNDGILFNKAQTSLIAFPGGKTGAYTIPNSVTSIGNAAFNGCTGLTSVTLPSSITSIGQETFSRCSGLTSVYFMGNAPDTDSYIFENSFNLTVYHSPDSAGWGATFANRPTALWFADGLLGLIKGNAITITGRATKPTGDLIIPSTINGLPVTSIGADAFYGSYELTSITLPSSLTSIGEAAFYGCSGLTSITIPSGVTFIGSESFMWCDGLTGVYFLGNAPAKGYGVFGGVLDATVYCVNGKSGWGATFAGRPTAKWVPVEPPVPTVNTLVVQVSPFIQNPSWASVATNSFPNSGLKQFYRMRASVVEVTVDLKNPSWTPVATNNFPSSGSQLFYRLVAQ